MSATAASGGNLGLRTCRSTRTSPVDGGSEAGLREPEVAFGIDGQKARIDLFPAVGQKLEGVGDHAIIGQERLLLDLGAQRDHAVAVVPGDVIVRAIGLIGGAGFRADIDRLFRQQVRRAHIGEFRSRMRA